MSGKLRFFERFNRQYCHFKGYCSILGLKIALTVAFFMLVPALLYLLFHEYHNEGFKEAYTVVTSPFLWGGMILSFILLMYALSKIVILPLKRFELHIAELEQGKTVEPFELDSNDEIGYLADRFSSLQRVIANKLESRDIQLQVLYDFTNSTSGIFDIGKLMDSFFGVLRTAVDFDIGAYVMLTQGRIDGRIYSTFESLEDGDAAELTQRLASRAAGYCHDFPKEKMKRLDVLRIEIDRPQSHSSKDAASHFVELPLMFCGEPIGVIALISYRGTGTDPVIGSRVFSAMVRHANTVIERLLSHISAEDRRLTNILSSMSEGVYLIDRNGRTASVNRKGMELVGLFCKHSLECSRQNFSTGIGQCSHPAEACEFSMVVNNVRNSNLDLDGKVHTEEIKNKEGQIIQVSVSELKNEKNEKEGYVLTAKDVTEDRLIQKRVMLSSKLAALGEMAAGIAHEVNNPLQVMMANIELLELNVGEKGARRIEHLKDAILRIKGIVRDLLIFAREQTTEVEDIDINKVMEKAADIMRHQLKVGDIALELDLDRRSCVVRCNRNLFQQVLINLIQNAKDALEEHRKGSRINIRTVLLPAGIVVAEVSDDGPGIPENVIDRIFDPFFTTKDVGKGTGLGLSVSRRIVEGMGGNITVLSSPKVGTTFTITLLQSGSRRAEDRHAEGVERDYSKLQNKSVIIVDDEEGVLKAVKDSLGSRVSNIEVVTDGRDALENIMDRDYDLILLDIKMPGMNGMELYRSISENKPYLAERVIFLTGDTENESTASFIKLTGCRFLSKPFAMKELLNIMCEFDVEMS